MDQDVLQLQSELLYPDENSHVVPATATAEEAAKWDIKRIPFSGYYKQLLDEPGEKFLMLVHGLPWNGKTFFSLGFAKYLAENFGNVMYVTPEQYHTVALRDLINAVEAVKIRQLEFCATLEDAGDLRRFDFVFIDSATAAKLTIEQLRALRKKYPHLAVVLILQSTKDGGFRGGQDWAHEVDIQMTVEDCTAHIKKNRFLRHGQKPEPLPIPYATQTPAAGTEPAPDHREGQGASAALNGTTRKKKTSKEMTITAHYKIGLIPFAYLVLGIRVRHTAGELWEALRKNSPDLVMRTIASCNSEIMDTGAEVYIDKMELTGYDQGLLEDGWVRFKAKLRGREEELKVVAGKGRIFSYNWIKLPK